MFLAHSIRLRDPWQCEELEDGACRWSRVFHRPSGLEPDDQLVLVISGLPPNAQLTVNGHELKNPPAPSPYSGRDGEGGEAGTSNPSRTTSNLIQFNLTPMLADSNQIELLIPPTADSLQPTASSTSFPYDARLAIVATS
jgi:hypothetical protein